MIKKQDFEKYTKDEIVEVIVKYKITFHPEKLLGELKRRKEKKLWDNYEKISKQAENKRKEYIDYLKMLESKYGKITLKNLSNEEINKMNVLNKEVEALSFKEDIAYNQYELEYGNN